MWRKDNKQLILFTQVHEPNFIQGIFGQGQGQVICFHGDVALIPSA